MIEGTLGAAVAAEFQVVADDIAASLAIGRPDCRAESPPRRALPGVAPWPSMRSSTPSPRASTAKPCDRPSRSSPLFLGSPRRAPNRVFRRAAVARAQPPTASRCSFAGGSTSGLGEAMLEVPEMAEHMGPARGRGRRVNAAHSRRAGPALRALAEADPALAALSLWCRHRDGPGPVARTSGRNHHLRAGLRGTPAPRAGRNRRPPRPSRRLPAFRPRPGHGRAPRSGLSGGPLQQSPPTPSVNETVAPCGLRPAAPAHHPSRGLLAEAFDTGAGAPEGWGGGVGASRL